MKFPSGPVFTDRRLARAWSTTVTVASGITPPLESLTVPAMEPLSCAKAQIDRAAATINATSVLRAFRTMYITPLFIVDFIVDPQFVAFGIAATMHYTRCSIHGSTHSYKPIAIVLIVRRDRYAWRGVRDTGVDRRGDPQGSPAGVPSGRRGVSGKTWPDGQGSFWATGGRPAGVRPACSQKVSEDPREATMWSLTRSPILMLSSS